MPDCIVQAAQHVRAETVAGDANYKQFVRSFIENQLDRRTCIGATEDCGKWLLRRNLAPIPGQAKDPRIEVCGQPHSGSTPSGRSDQLGEGPVPRVQPPHGVVRVIRDGPNGARPGGVTVGDLNRHWGPRSCESTS